MNELAVKTFVAKGGFSAIYIVQRGRRYDIDLSVFLNHPIDSVDYDPQDDDNHTLARYTDLEVARAKALDYAQRIFGEWV